jgi:hypothetical protein
MNLRSIEKPVNSFLAIIVLDIYRTITLSAFFIEVSLGINAMIDAIGRICSYFLLGLGFILLITPVGIVLRFIDDPMARRLDQSKASYRVKSKATKPQRLEKPFL